MPLIVTWLVKSGTMVGFYSSSLQVMVHFGAHETRLRFINKVLIIDTKVIYLKFIIHSHSLNKSNRYSHLNHRKYIFKIYVLSVHTKVIKFKNGYSFYICIIFFETTIVAYILIEIIGKIHIFLLNSPALESPIGSTLSQQKGNPLSLDSLFLPPH